jgi:hypothetical protein
MHIIGVMLLLFFIVACGKSDSSAGMPVEKNKILPVDGSNIMGLYMAKFFTINPGVNGTLPGSATLQRQDDQFLAYVRLFGGAPNAWHQQNVHVGKRCPNASDDLNRDGYIDIEEGNLVWGKIILPLDSNLRSQKSGKNIYPIADATGSYFYERETSFEEMFNDLKSEDKDLNDPWIKLASDKGLDFEGKVVVVHGTASDIDYPPTVVSADNRPVFQTLPIACGVFKKVTKIPGEPYDGTIPGPIDPEVSGDEGGPANDPEYDEDRGNRNPHWYDRIINWWRETWERERGPRRRQDFGDGRRGWWIF